MAESNRLYDAVCFHAQQADEKYLAGPSVCSRATDGCMVARCCGGRFQAGRPISFHFSLSIAFLSSHNAGMKTVEEYQFTVLFEPAEEGGYVVTCPALPGLVTEGDTLAEARAMAEDAIRAYLASLRKDGLPIPEDKKLVLNPVKEQVRVALEVE